MSVCTSPKPAPSGDIGRAINDAAIEAHDAREKWPTYNSAHEGLGVLIEEVKELKDHVLTKKKDRDLSAMRRQAIQVAAVALRFAAELCTEERGRR